MSPTSLRTNSSFAVRIVVVVVLVVVLVVILAQGADAFADRPSTSDKGCQYMNPFHTINKIRIMPRDGFIPYQIILEPSSHHMNSIEFTIKSNDTNFPYFEGFYVQARLAAADPKSFKPNDILGKWSVPDVNSSAFARPHTCFDVADNVVGHKNNEHHVEAKLLWTPDEDFDGGRVRFYTTVVKSYNTFWSFRPSPDFEVRRSPGSTSSWLHRLSNGRRLHGSMMLISWGALFPVGVVTAKRFKGVFGGVVCGKPAWLQIHRALVILALLVSFVGLLVIRATLDWRVDASDYSVHQIVGWVALPGAGLNVLLGVVRPSPESKWRRIFNWTHFALGSVALAAGTMALLSGLLYHGGFCLWVPWTFVAVVVVVVFVVDVVAKTTEETRDPPAPTGIPLENVKDDVGGVANFHSRASFDLGGAAERRSAAASNAARLLWFALSAICCGFVVAALVALWEASGGGCKG